MDHVLLAPQRRTFSSRHGSSIGPSAIGGQGTVKAATLRRGPPHPAYRAYLLSENPWFRCGLSAVARLVQVRSAWQRIGDDERDADDDP